MPQPTVQTIFNNSLELESAEQRERYLGKACRDRPEVRRRVEQLLKAYAEAGAFLGGVSPNGSNLSEGGTADLLFSPEVGSQIGPYQILERLAEGGMGIVYVAEQQSPIRRRVALKLMKPGMATQDGIARFEAERQALAMMDHPNIAQVFDAGVTQLGQSYFAMELVHGLPITEFCDRRRLSNQQRLQLFLTVCRAVQHAHRKGIIHRDLKPSNILVAEIDGGAVPKVIDFGVAKAIGQKLAEQTIDTQCSQTVGTPLYMSPEQAGTGPVDIDTRSDVYSLGVLMYELLTGTTPFGQETLKAVGFDEFRRIIREDDPPLPSLSISSNEAHKRQNVAAHRQTEPQKLRHTLQGELDWIVMKALEKDCSRRYESALDLANDVQRHLNNEPVEACPSSVFYRFKKTVRRNRLMASVVSTIALILVASSTFSVWQMVKARRAQAISMARELQASDLLEAARLQTALDAFRQQDLVRLAAATAPMRPAIDPRLGAGFSHSCSLTDLLSRAANPVAQRSYGHSAAVQDFGVSADGTRMVSIDLTGAVRVWDLASGQSGQILGSHEEQAGAVAISPDGSQAVSGSTTGQLWFWDLNQGVLEQRLAPLASGIESLAWSPNGRYVAAGARYSETRVYDAQGHELLQIKNNHRHETILFTPDSRQLFVPTRQGIDVWDVAAGARITTFSMDPLNNVRALCWAGPQQRWLVAGDRFSESLVVFDRETGVRLGNVLTAAAYAQSLAASADGQWLAARYADGRLQMIRLTSPPDGEVAAEVHWQFPVFPAEETKPTIAWLGDSHRFLTSGEEGEVLEQNLDLIIPRRIIKEPAPLQAAYALGRHELVTYRSALQGPGVQPYHSGYLGEPASAAGSAIPFPIQAFAVEPAQRQVAVAGAHQIAIVSLESGEIIGTVESPLAKHQHVTLTADASVVAASHVGRVYVWRSENGWLTNKLVGAWGMDSFVSPVLADDGRTLIVDESRQQLTERDLATGKVSRIHQVAIDSTFCVSHDNGLLAAGTDRGLRVWNRHTGEDRLAASNLSATTSLRFLADDRILVSGHEDGKIRAWHLPTGLGLGVLYAPPHPLGKLIALVMAAGDSRLIAWYWGPEGLQLVILGVEPPLGAAAVAG